MFITPRRFDEEVARLERLILAHRSTAAKAAETERKRRATLLDALLKIQDSRRQGDDLDALLTALESWID